MTTVKTVPDRLAALGEIYRERNKFYRDNYKRFGIVLRGLFPDGIHCDTEEEMNRLALFFNIVHKVTRYAHSIKNGGHADSLDDIAVYTQMTAEFDEIMKGSRL